MTRVAFMALCALLLPGCVSVKLPPPQAVIENTVALRDAGIDKVNVGNFTLAAGKDKGIPGNRPENVPFSFPSRLRHDSRLK